MPDTLAPPLAAPDVATLAPPTPAYRQALAAILVFNALVTLPFLGNTTLWIIDEGRIAEISREMVESGNWIVPRIGGMTYPCYPPLQNWLMALSGLTFGFNEFAMRLPSVLAGIALIAIIGRLGRRLAGDSVGLAAAFTAATLSGFLVQQTTARADMLVTLFATIAFDSFLAIAGGDTRPRQRAVLYVAVGLGILAKGPLAFIIPGLGIAGWLLLHRRWSVLRDLRFEIGIPVVVAIAAPWYIAAWRSEGWDFLKANLLLENVSAFTSGFDHPKPMWMYLAWVPSRMLPWVLFLPMALRVPRTPALKVALAWFGLTLLFLTLSSSKRPNYVTYLYPSFALTTGIVLAAVAAASPKAGRRILLAAAGGLAALSIAVSLPLPWKGTLGQLAPVLPAMSLAGLLGSAALAGITWPLGMARGAVALGLLSGLGWMAFNVACDPRIDSEGRRGVDFCRQVRATVPPEERVWTSGPEMLDGMFSFYVGHAILVRHGDPGYYLLTEEQYKRLGDEGWKLRPLLTLKDDRQRGTYLTKVTK